ncbi:MAG: cyclic nucleotide-binding domain-containing protein [Caldilineaceae bacterium]
MNPINLFRNADNQKSYAPGDVIFRKGDRGNYMYVVMEGEVDIVLDGTYIRTLEPGAIFGEMSLIDDSPRSATPWPAPPACWRRWTSAASSSSSTRRPCSPCT